MSQVFVILRAYWGEGKDSHLDTSAFEAHSTLASANAAARKLVQVEAAELDGPQVDEDVLEDGTFTAQTLSEGRGVGVKVQRVDLVGATVTLSADAKQAPKKSTKATTETAKPSKATKSAKSANADVDDEEEPAKPAKQTKAAASAANGEKATKAKAASKTKAGKAAAADKQHPQGDPDALSGRTICITGTLEGYTRPEAKAVLENHGAHVVSAISRNVNLILLGTNAGPKKLDQIEELGIEKIDWAGVCQLIENSAGASTKRDAEEEEPATEKRAAKRGKKAAA